MSFIKNAHECLHGRHAKKASINSYEYAYKNQFTFWYVPANSSLLADVASNISHCDAEVQDCVTMNT